MILPYLIRSCSVIPTTYRLDKIKKNCKRFLTCLEFKFTQSTWIESKTCEPRLDELLKRSKGNLHKHVCVEEFVSCGVIPRGLNTWTMITTSVRPDRSLDHCNAWTGWLILRPMQLIKPLFYCWVRWSRLLAAAREQTWHRVVSKTEY